MMNVKNKRHWYDGWIYDRLLAPNQKESFNIISDLVPEGSSVIDIGCGTGRLSYRLAEKCSLVTGIDLSYINIATAIENLGDKYRKVRFIHTSLDDFKNRSDNYFDYAIMSYIIHEVNKDERTELLKDAVQVAGKLIIADHFPKTGFIAGIIREILEFFAGKDHYLSYRSFIRSGGIRKLAESAGLKIIHEQIFRSHLHITVLAMHK